MTLQYPLLGVRFSLFGSLLATAALLSCSNDAHRLGGAGASGSGGEGQAGRSAAGTSSGGHAEGGTSQSRSGASSEAGADDPSGGAQNLGGSGPDAASAGGHTCPILFPTAPTYYPGDADSPCPKQPIRITDPDRTCDKSLLGTRCVYPAVESPDAQEVWTCELVGGLNGEDTPGAYGEWAQGLMLCDRTGLDCRAEDTEPVLMPDADSCESSPTPCSVDFDVTAQEALDRTVSSLLGECLASAELSCTTASLSVRFESGCAVDFVVEPTALASCVQTALQSGTYWRPSCALNLSCSSVEVGGCL